MQEFIKHFRRDNADVMGVDLAELLEEAYQQRK